MGQCGRRTRDVVAAIGRGAAELSDLDKSERTFSMTRGVVRLTPRGARPRRAGGTGTCPCGRSRPIAATAAGPRGGSHTAPRPAMSPRSRARRRARAAPPRPGPAPTGSGPPAPRGVPAPAKPGPDPGAGAGASLVDGPQPQADQAHSLVGPGIGDGEGVGTSRPQSFMLAFEVARASAIVPDVGTVVISGTSGSSATSSTTSMSVSSKGRSTTGPWRGTGISRGSITPFDSKHHGRGNRKSVGCEPAWAACSVSTRSWVSGPTARWSLLHSLPRSTRSC